MRKLKSTSKDSAENLIHVMFEMNEAVSLKREILHSEKSFLIMAKIVRNYSILRRNELRLKAGVYRKLKEVMSNINKLQKSLPRIKIPEFLHKEKAEREESYRDERKGSYLKSDIESQLQEIQEKLRALGAG